MKSSKDRNTDVENFVDSVVKDKNVKSNELLERIVRRKVEKHIRKTLRSSGGR